MDGLSATLMALPGDLRALVGVAAFLELFVALLKPVSLRASVLVLFLKLN